MKKIIILLSVAIAALAVSCNKVTPQDSTPDAPKGEKITITVSLSDALSKVSLTQDPEDPDGAIKVAWQATDKIFVIDASNPNNFEAFSIVAGSIDTEKPYTATFEGTAPDASSFNILYGATSVSAANSFNSEQTQTGNASTDHLQYKALISGVSSIENIEFSKTWAETNGGSFSQNGALRLRIQVPTEVTSVASVSLTAPSEIFSGSETITVKFVDNVAPVNGIITAYAMLPMGDAIEVADEDFEVTIATAEENEYYKTFSPGAISFKPGQTNAIKLNKSGFTNNLFAGGTGLEGDPYLIATAKHMQNMHIVMKDNAVIYFKMIDDIDMTDVEWVSLNNSGSFSKGINFDGDNHKISNLTVGSSNAYPSLFGVLNGSAKDIEFDNATITGEANCAGVLAGYIGSSTASVSGTCSGIIVNNSKVTGSKRGLGGLAGMVSKLSAPITNCSVNNTTVTSTADRVGGLAGQTEKLMSINNCSANNVTVKGTINIGGLIGVGYGNAMNCTSSGSISSTNTTSNADIGLGGLIGYFENGTVSSCSSSVNINQTTNGRDVGGLIGKMLAATLTTSYATGDVSSLQRNASALVGLVTLTSGVAVISDCYATGNLTSNAYSGSIVGLFEKGTLQLLNCYATGSVSGAFGMGGIVGFIGAATIDMKHCVAWNSSIKASSIGASNWSSGAVAGVAYPTANLTDNYRSPNTNIKAYWGNVSGYTKELSTDYDHPNVSSSSPLIIVDKTSGELRATTATSTGNTEDNYPLYAYQGKHVSSGTTLSQLASTTLGWSSAIWDFTGDLPTLK